ncbi:hypothetical protein [Streptomyces malaysiensis]|uniref:hypothetical protein n=1 Tax=Streptomyces malaysiensis TaxID=92644 RepID=UPI002B29944E|nr:hypothetical protein R8789_16605 [Streptomyces malaysiensis]
MCVDFLRVGRESALAQFLNIDASAVPVEQDESAGKVSNSHDQCASVDEKISFQLWVRQRGHQALFALSQ